MFIDLMPINLDRKNRKKERKSIPERLSVSDIN